MKFSGKTNEFIELKELGIPDCGIFDKPEPSSLSVIWFQDDGNHFNIDGKDYFFKKNQIVFITEFHKVKVVKKSKTHFLRFNRPFYCVIDHDTEVGCSGLLFFGASQLPIIEIPDDEVDRFNTLWTMFTQEMQSRDNLQLEMLQMMLKRYLILCARLYKLQNEFPAKVESSDLIRNFNFLVEKNFKKLHTVAEYAALVHKSPKTISNVFSKLGAKTPLQYIQERKMLEARRLLSYTDMQVKEIALELGFEDLQTFSRFFKKQEGVSPTVFKNSVIVGLS